MGEFLAITKNDIIQGEKFITLSNNEDIFYTDIHNVYSFFNNPPNNDFILITHNSDGCITNTPKRFDNGSSNDIDINKINGEFFTFNNLINLVRNSHFHEI